jgi:putative addiction module killer protein
MLEIRQTREFSDWLRGLDDMHARARILVRIDRLALGNPGDWKALGDGVSELRIPYGPGYRVYFAQRGKVLVVLLVGGTKQRQARDVALAKRLARDLEE